MDLKKPNCCFASYILVNWLKHIFYIAIERRLLLNDIFLFWTLFNDNEYLAVPFVKLARGRSRVGHLLFFYLYRITCLRFLQWHKLNLTLPSAYLLPSILLSACFYGWSDSNVTLIHLTIIGLFQGIICNIHSVTPLPLALT